MHPMLNMSQTLLYLQLRSLRLATSGATYPGVPHFGNANYFTVSKVDNPKSTILNDLKLFSSLNIIFSGFKSRCIT